MTTAEIYIYFQANCDLKTRYCHNARFLPPTLPLPHGEIVDVPRMVDTSLTRLDSPVRCLATLAAEALEQLISHLKNK